MVKITALVPEPAHGLFYQRLRIPFKRLDPAKYHVEFVSFEDPWWRMCKQSDVFVLAHASMPETLTVLEALKADGKRVILDHDDLLDQLPSDHPEYWQLGHCKNSVPWCLAKADHVVVTTRHLERQARLYSKNVSVIENHFDTEILPAGYEPRAKAYKRGFTVGWVGGATHVADQYEFIEALDWFMTKFPEVRAHFKVLCPQRLLTKFGARIFYDPTVTYHLDYHAWVSTLPWDLCLVGLQPHPFNDAKSDMRLVDMGLHGIPCIASAREDFVKHRGHDRVILADGVDEWKQALVAAYECRDELKRFGANARQWVLEERNDYLAAGKWERVLSAVIDQTDRTLPLRALPKLVGQETLGAPAPEKAEPLPEQWLPPESPQPA